MVSSFLRTTHSYQIIESHYWLYNYLPILFHKPNTYLNIFLGWRWPQRQKEASIHPRFHHFISFASTGRHRKFRENAIDCTVLFLSQFRRFDERIPEWLQRKPNTSWLRVYFYVKCSSADSFAYHYVNSLLFWYFQLLLTWWYYPITNTNWRVHNGWE